MTTDRPAFETTRLLAILRRMAGDVTDMAENCEALASFAVEENNALQARVAELEDVERERDELKKVLHRRSAKLGAAGRKLEELQAQLDRAKDIIDNVIDAWHENSGDTRGLHEALGMTVPEYNQYFVNGLSNRATEPRADGIRYVAATECDVHPENDHHYIAKWTPDGPVTLTEMEQAHAVAQLNSMGEPTKPRPMSEAPRDGMEIVLHSHARLDKSGRVAQLHQPHGWLPATDESREDDR